MSDIFKDLSLRELLAQYDLRLNHNLGQNFLSSPTILNEIVAEANVCSTDQVLEVGAGAGTLTAALAATGAKVTSIEIDETLRPLLQDRFADCENVSLLFGDARSFDLATLVQPERPLKIVANIPYYITTPLIEQFLSQCPETKSVVLTVQKEVADNLMQTSGKLYGPLNVLAHVYGEVKIAMVLPSHLFTPAPNVTSAVLALHKRENALDLPLAEFYRFVKQCFSQRRKTLSNNIKVYGESARTSLLSFLQEYNFQLSARPEQISPEYYVSLYNYLR